MDKQAAKKVIHFPKGLPGFEEYKTFVLTEETEDPLAQLSAADNRDVGFVLFKPQLLFADYLAEVEINEEETELLAARADDRVDVWVILTLCLRDMRLTTANLRAPVIINPRTQRGIQLILDQEKYSSRYPLFADIAGSQADSSEPGRG
jgi:flagellar assembly factor FliW